MLLEPTAQPGSAWLAIVSRPSVSAFAQAFATHVTLEATALAIPLRGVESLHNFFLTTRSMYDRIAFVQEMRSKSRVCLEWEGVFQGNEISGATLLTYDSTGTIERIRLFHYPYDQLNAFSAELARRRGLKTNSINALNGVNHENER
jgi:hypothetical protein